MQVIFVDGDLSPELLGALQRAGRIAVDTETTGLNWSSDELRLCQLYAPATGPVLLRDVVTKPENLSLLMGDTGVTKVFHFAPFDLKFLESQWGVRVASVECTKTASKLLDPSAAPAAHGLQALLAAQLGVTIGKGAVRTSDWGASSLTEEQVDYAVGDVVHLLRLIDCLRAKLDEVDRLELYKRVCAYLPVSAHLEVSGVPDPLAY